MSAWTLLAGVHNGDGSLSVHHIADSIRTRARAPNVAIGIVWLWAATERKAIVLERTSASWLCVVGRVGCGVSGCRAWG